MLRTFTTNRFRALEDLSGSGWTFEPLSGEHAGTTYDVTVPCLWETIPGFYDYRGQGRFSKTFVSGEDIRLIFKGVSHTAEVFVDGTFIGKHYNAYTAFSFIVRGLEPGQHTLSVIADNRFSEASALHIPNDYMTYGGINRAVAVETLNQALLTGLSAVPEKTESGWILHVEATVLNVSQESEYAGILSLRAADSQVSTDVELAPAEENTFLFDIACADVKVWTPESPALYEVHAVLTTSEGEIIDDLIERTGFREVKIVGKDILLNGRKLRIKGFCRHEDHGLFGNALPLSAIQQDILLLKDLHGNAFRTSHYPNDELFLDLCDEQGILVWEENHARGLSEEMMRNPNFQRQALDCIREMIPVHKSHPCIFIWGILNECASDTQYGYECYKEQYELIDALDSSRPKSSASCRFKTDICLGLPDVVSYNIYPEWYVPEPAADYLADLYNWVQRDTEGSGKPFLITETGAGAIYGYHTPEPVKWSEEYQAQALSKQITAVLNQEGCSGIFLWQFADVRVSDEWFGSRPKTMNNKGVVDEYRRKKLAYAVVKDLFGRCSTYADEA